MVYGCACTKSKNLVDLYTFIPLWVYQCILFWSWNRRTSVLFIKKMKLSLFTITLILTRKEVVSLSVFCMSYPLYEYILHDLPLSLHIFCMSYSLYAYILNELLSPCIYFGWVILSMHIFCMSYPCGTFVLTDLCNVNLVMYVLQ